jgi:hypothetical protein
MHKKIQHHHTHSEIQIVFSFFSDLLKKRPKIRPKHLAWNISKSWWRTFPSHIGLHGTYSTYRKSLEAREDLMQKRCFCSPLSTTVFNRIISNLVCTLVEVVKTPLIFFRFLFSFSEVLLTRSKSLWKAGRTLCKLSQFGLFLQLNG